MKNLTFVGMAFLMCLHIQPAYPAEDCDAGAVLDQFFCFRDELAQLQKNLDVQFAKVRLNTKSDWGDEALPEMRQRLKDGQDGWKKYMQSVCLANYYSKAETHPPSQSLDETKCEIRMTKFRLEELRDMLPQPVMQP